MAGGQGEPGIPTFYLSWPYCLVWSVNSILGGSCFSGPPPFTQAWPGLLCWGLEHAPQNQDFTKSYFLSEQMEQLTKKSLQLLLDNWRVLRARSSSCLLCLAAPEIPVFTNTESLTNEHTGPGANWMRHRHRYWGFCWERQEKVINTKGQDSACTMSAQVVSEADSPRGNIPGSLAHTHLWVTMHRAVAGWTLAILMGSSSLPSHC